MKKLTALALCLALLLSLCAAGNAEQTAKEMQAIEEWEKEYGVSALWDYRVSAAFAAAHPDFFDDPSMMPVLPDGNDPETISAEKAKKLAFSLLPRYSLGITADELFGLECVVSSYRKPEYVGSFFSINGAWNVTFWNTAGETPEMVYSLYLDAVCETADVLVTASGVRYECFYEEPEDAVRVDPYGENDDAGRARLEARKIAAEKFDAGYGIDDYYAGLIDTFGLFLFWTPEQKHEYCPILDELVVWEKQRLELSGWDQAYKGFHVSDMILQWSYGAPESAAVPEAEARQKALDFLQAEYGLDCSGCNAGAALYTGHWHDSEFPDPYWVFVFCEGPVNEPVRKAEVWVNAMTGTLPKYRADDVWIVVRNRFTASLVEDGFEIGGEPATQDMIDDVAVLYLEEANEWLGIVTVGDSFLEVEVDADTLEVLDASRSNG
ncbi:MAG: hypothetical protein ABS897_10460 [Eubacteriales bacterium]